MMNVEDLYRLLRMSHVQAQGIVDTVADPMLVLDENLRVQSASRSFFERFKVDRYETVGQLVYELGNGQWNIPELRVLLMEVVPRSAIVIDFRVEHDFPELGRRTMLLTARPLFHPDNASHSLLLTIVDATDRSHEDAAKDILVGELRHRIKNLLSVAQAIARQTSTAGRSAEEYRDTYLGRLGALVAAQELAFAEPGEAGLTELFKGILKPYAAASDAVLIEGGVEFELRPRVVQSLGLVIHELATNAAKYGALSVPGGQVRIRWQLEDANSSLRLSWVESGGPPVSPPDATGYGSQLIQSSVTYSLRGQVEQVYAPSGLQAEIVIPIGKASFEMKADGSKGHFNTKS